MRGKTKFTKISSREAKQAAFEDMKKEGIRSSVLNHQSSIFSQPTLTIRAGLFGI